MNVLNLRRVALSTVVLILMRAIANSRSLRPGSSGSATGARARILSPAPGTSSPDLTVTVLSRVRVALEALPGFGGMWVSDDNRLAVALVGQLTASALVGMRRSVPADITVEVRSVQRSWADLLRLLDRPSNRMQALAETGIQITQVGVDVQTNTVEVVVASSSSSNADAQVTAMVGTAHEWSDGPGEPMPPVTARAPMPMSVRASASSRATGAPPASISSIPWVSIAW
jgi:hypothetical protein